MTRLRIGVVGCGEATQALHLPTLRFLSDRFVVTAVCDPSRQVVDAVARRWDVPARCTSADELVARDDVDAVLVAAPSQLHAEVTLAAIAAGKHVLVEKPLCLGLDEGRAVVEAADASGLVVQVGYMRRHASAFAAARREVERLPAVRLARVHAVLGRNALILGQAHSIVRGDDLPPALVEETRAREAAMVAQTIGDDSPEWRDAYLFLVTLNSHDLSVLRGLLGEPHGILYASKRGTTSPYLSAAFDYGSFVCHFETGFDEIPRVDTHVEVYADDRIVRLEYDSPYVRNLPVRLRTTAVDGHGGMQRTVSESWEDPFTSEWTGFFEAVRHGGAVVTPPADALADLQLARDVVAAMRG